jgi:hypothetical protein
MENNKYTRENKREHFRVRYPISCRPGLRLLNCLFEVIDISEHGIRFSGNKINQLQAEMEVMATVTFNDGSSLKVKGRILRVDKEVAVMYIAESIPFGRIMAEQRFIKVNYPKY